MSQDQEQQQLFSSAPTSLQLPKSLHSLPSLTIVPHISQPHSTTSRGKLNKIEIISQYIHRSIISVSNMEIDYYIPTGY